MPIDQNLMNTLLGHGVAPTPSSSSGPDLSQIGITGPIPSNINTGDLAAKYGETAGSIYSGLNIAGGNQASVYQNNYLGLLNRQGALAGLGPNTINVGGNPNVGATGLRNPVLPGQQQTAVQADANNPYALDQYQMQQWNQQAAGIAQSAKSAIASFQEQMNRSGLTDPRLMQIGTEQLQEHFAAIHAEAETKFYEQVKADKQAALDAITKELADYGKSGIAQEETAAGGYSNLQGNFLQQKAQQDALAAQNQQAFWSTIGGLGAIAATL